MKECPGINHSTLEIWDLEECRITDKEDQCGKSFHRRFSNIKTYREEVEELIMLEYVADQGHIPRMEEIVKFCEEVRKLNS